MGAGLSIHYDVAITVAGTWKQHVFTYRHDQELPVGQVVIVPFGEQTKLGFIIRQSTKQQTDVELKDIAKVTTYRLSSETLRLYDWLTDNYPNVGGLHVQHLLPKAIQTIKSPGKSRETSRPELAPELTETQKQALEEIESADKKPVVLYGITGSGKTRLYIELAHKVLGQGKNVLLLYPEISLTSQLEKTLAAHLSDFPLYTYHSKQTGKQQLTTWHGVHEATGGTITIGPRSALFLPHQNLGLIIIDEAHDGSYKQDTGSRYHGLLVAAALAGIHKAGLVLGSATPPVQETHQIMSKGGKLVQMLDLAIKQDESTKQYGVVDMTNKSNLSQASHLLSKQLLSAIKDSLANNKQILLFLNRRGTARMLLCDNCGWHAQCPRCESPTTYHHDSFTSQCHVCGFSSKAPVSCPDCNNELKQKAPGVKAMETTLAKLFPGAKIGRFDSDNKKSEAFHAQYEDIRDGKVDIILGTQLITKGLDLPLLETVGVLQADSALALPDFASEERAFQLLTQVSGRVGRGHGDGQVILQTYMPNNPLFADVQAQDWQAFYKHELKRRKTLHYPPFTYLAKITCKKPSSDGARNMCSAVREKIESQFGNSIRVLGPAPSFYGKVGLSYSWQLVLQCASRKQLLEAVQGLPADCIADIDPVSLL